jgi:hypothetical protein
MLPDPVTLSLDDAAGVAIDYNTILMDGRKTTRRGTVVEGTVPNVASHAPVFAAEVSHQETKAKRERSLLKLSCSTVHSTTGAKESVSISLIIDKDPSGALAVYTCEALLVQLANILNVGLQASMIDINSIQGDTVLGQFINGEA